MPIRISGSTGISGLDGSATTPVLQGASANSGIYYSGNTVFVSTSGTNAMTIGPTGNVNFANSSVSIGGQALSSAVGMRNRIINGDMRIAQRGTSATGLTSDITYRTIDRWRHFLSATTSPTYTVRQSTDAPANFLNSMELLVTTGATMSSDGVAILGHDIEGNNLSDFAFGSSDAKTFTISFWVKSNVTGTYVLEPFSFSGGSAVTRTISRTYTINAANTWEYKTITFPGDTTGVMNTDSNSGLRIHFWFGAGSASTSGTLNNTWASAATQANRAPGVGTAFGATTNNYIKITGIQLEAGSVATPFEFRPYGTELALCQRYFETNYAYGTAVGAASGTSSTYLYTPGLSNGSHTGQQYVQFKVTKRANPTMTMYSPSSGNSGYLYDYNGPTDKSGNWQFVGPHSAVGYGQSLTTTTNINIAYNWTANAEL